MDHLPLFVISFNRGRYLRRVIESYRRQDVPLSVVIHDNGSDDADTLRALGDLERDGCRIYRGPKIAAADDLNLVEVTVRDHCARTGYDGPFAVSDCDVDLSTARPDAIRLYLELLERCPDRECVGPMLRIADIPRSYPLFDRVMRRHVNWFWKNEPEWIDTRVGRVAVLRRMIDTTFAVHRAGLSFRRLRPGLRVYHPFEARHLDWYIGDADDSAYRATSSKAIAHWSNVSEPGERGERRAPRMHLWYVTVEGELPNLTLRRRHTADNVA